MNEAGIFTQVRDVPGGLLLDRASLGRRAIALGVYHGRSGQPKNRNLSLQAPERLTGQGGGWVGRGKWVESHCRWPLFLKMNYLALQPLALQQPRMEPKDTCPFSKHRPDF